MPARAVVSPPTEKPDSSSFLVNIPPFLPLSLSSLTKRAALTCDSSVNGARHGCVRCMEQPQGNQADGGYAEVGWSEDVKFGESGVPPGP